MISDAQMKGPKLEPIIHCLKDGILPEDSELAKKVRAESTMNAMFNDILYYVRPKQTKVL